MRVDLDTNKYNVVIDSSNFDVNIGESARIDVGQAVTYIKSGEKEIETYIETVSKPSIDNYISDYATPIVSNIVNDIAEDLVLGYVDNTVKPNLDDYANQKTDEYNSNATNSIVTYNQNASTLLTEFNTNATEKTNSFNTLAADKTNLVNTYVNEAKGYKDNAKTSETNAKTSESNALNYKNSASSSASTATSQANIATTKASEAAVSAARAENATSNKANLNLGNSTAITNCITEIPQDIKLELNNGTLTLKAGSKVYVPNGAGKFDEKIVSSDVVVGNRTGTGVLLLSVRKSSNAVDSTFIGNCLSGASLTPATTSLHYDTANNIIRRYSSSVDTYYESSLPFALIKLTDGVYTSIDQTFNGFGYIGSTVFALPGVKGLAPNGRNEDGSLKNIIRVIDKVSVFSFTGSGTAVFAFADNALGFSNYVYDVQTNRNTEYNNVRTNVIFGSGSFVNGKITSFTPKLPFRAVDYNDFSQLNQKFKVVTELPTNPDKNVFYFVTE